MSESGASAAVAKAGHGPVIEDGEILSWNPRTGEILERIPVTPVEAIPGIVKEAREAQQSWETLGFRRRRQAMQKVAQCFIDNIDEIAERLARENGKTVYEAILTEILGTIDFLNWFPKVASKALKDKKVPLHLVPGARSYLSYSPAGVIGVIAPWNYPLMTPISDIAPALAAGNAVVFKPSEYSSGTGKLILEIFERAGFPKGVLRAVYGGGDVGAALIGSGVNHIGFTGSTPTGKKVMAKAAETLTPVTLELGGKDPAIVMPDADLDQAADGILWGGFSNMGQTCASVERVYIHSSIYDQFRDRLVERARGLTCDGSEGSQLGTMNNRLQASKVRDQLEDAEKKGAKVSFKLDPPEQGFYAPPTILEGLDPEMCVVSEETFGPIIPLFRYDTETEVVEAANDSPFGLTASVWTRNTSHGERLARALHAGVVTINDHMITPGFAEAPWGGVKQSGIGRIKSEDALRQFSEVKYIYHDNGLLKFKAWRFPYTPGKLRFLKDLAVAYNDISMTKRVAALIRVLPKFITGVKD